MAKGKNNTDRIAAILVFLFSAVFIWQLRYINSPLDVLFPRTILIAMLILSVILLIKSFFWPDPRSIKNIFDIQNRNKVLTGVFGSVLWLLGIPFLGFAVTSALALIVFSIALGKKKDRTLAKIISTVLVCSAIVAVIYYFFAEFMEVQFPKALLF
jgi:undecaprenyl pyrophosphate phosphatase UppP